MPIARRLGEDGLPIRIGSRKLNEGLWVGDEPVCVLVIDVKVAERGQLPAAGDYGTQKLFVFRKA